MFPGETILSQKDLGMPIDKHCGEFKVIRSEGSGNYYIGTMMVSCGESDCEDCGYRALPKGEEVDYNSRETGYWDTKEEAEDALKAFKHTGDMPLRRV